MQFIGKTKAGLQFSDESKIIIQEAVKDTEYEKRKIEKRKSYQKTVDEYQSLLSNFPEVSIESAKKYIEQRIDDIEQFFYNKDTTYYLYLDIDMFYAAVEIIEKPYLKDKPVIVGSSIVSAANYVARKYGIRSAMPVFVANKLCKDLVKLDIDKSKYSRYSERVYKILRIFDPNLQNIGQDEACLNISQYLESSKDAIEFTLSQQCKAITLENKMNLVMNQIQKQIFQTTQLTVSQGIAPNKYLAKLASEHNKPNGQYIITLDKQKIYEFINQKDVRQLKGVGVACEYILKGLGIITGKQLRDNLYKIYLTSRAKTFNSLLEKSIGYEDEEIKEIKNPSYFKSKTFEATSNLRIQKQILMECSEELQQKLKEHNLIYKRFALVLTFDNFKKISLQDSLIDHNFYLKPAVKKCIENLKTFQDQKIRLIGIKLSDFKIKKNEIQNIEKCIRELSSKKKLKKIDSFNFESEKGQIISMVECPICNKKIDTKGINKVLNNHIDKCLRNTNNQFNIKMAVQQ